MPTARPQNHESLLDRARLALDGLSIGDGFGERFFGVQQKVEWMLGSRALPGAPWTYSDDTEMALSIYEILKAHGAIDQDALAMSFLRRYQHDPGRGYGGGAHRLLQQLGEGVPWQEASRRLFDGQGSMGNGGAMRAAPLGAYFADDMEALVRNAQASAEVTHAHPDGQAGAIAVAAAAAFAHRNRGRMSKEAGCEMLAFAMKHTPPGYTKDGLANGLNLGLEVSVQLAVGVLGNGVRILSSDTVPFALWCAARHFDDFVEAMWIAVSALGDRDSTCAMVGGIVALAVGREGLPKAWLEMREPLRI